MVHSIGILGFIDFCQIYGPLMFLLLLFYLDYSSYTTYANFNETHQDWSGAQVRAHFTHIFWLNEFWLSYGPCLVIMIFLSPATQYSSCNMQLAKMRLHTWSLIALVIRLEPKSFLYIRNCQSPLTLELTL
jgi:hypothetical protein